MKTKQPIAIRSESIAVSRPVERAPSPATVKSTEAAQRLRWRRELSAWVGLLALALTGACSGDSGGTNEGTMAAGTASPTSASGGTMPTPGTGTIPATGGTAPTDDGGGQLPGAPSGGATSPPSSDTNMMPGPGGTQAPGDPTQPSATTPPGGTDGVGPDPTMPSPDPSMGPDGVPPDEVPIYTPPATPPEDENGSQLWLRYPPVSVEPRLTQYRTAFTHVVEAGGSPTLKAAEEELVLGLGGLTGMQVSTSAEAQGAGAVVLGTPDSSPTVAASPLAGQLAALGPEGYLVETTPEGVTIVAGNTDVGVLYGSFALLRHLQSHLPIANLSLSGAPKIGRRVLNHWDNLNRTVERGYAGSSLWDWDALPGSLSPRYEDYARANASVGINGTVLTNVNANADVLTPQYLDKVAALADVFRPYGIAVYLTARFSAPIEIGGLSTADPSNSGVQQWWADKATEIYERIPDFGGFLVKANSEGQPGPQDYGRSHADGANALARAVAPHGGIVMWRAFVYSESSPTDRIRQAYDEFKPLDGQFEDNVVIQVKNGPLDFQPREPFSPLFGATPSTPLALELQITKEYLGQDTHLAYLGPMYEEVLQADTFADGAGSTVARVVDGTLHGHATTVIAGVSNVGSDTNWSGSHFNQANWYVYGRMAWDPDITAEAVADEWIRQTLSNDPAVVQPVLSMMMASHQAVVDYMTPLGLVHIMATDHHYGPGPWVNDLSRAEWNPTYYHKADANGIGFDRTETGSNAVAQYAEPVRDQFASRDTVPEDLLLFFHEVGWDEPMSTGRTLWEEMVHRYSVGVDAVGAMRREWSGVQGLVDQQRFEEIDSFLQIQHYEARWWRDACLQYFRQFGDRAIPDGYAEPANALSFYQGLSCPGDVTKPRCSQVYTGEPSPAVLSP